jgi:hypothetical protein
MSKRQKRYYINGDQYLGEVIYCADEKPHNKSRQKFRATPGSNRGVALNSLGR